MRVRVVDPIHPDHEAIEDAAAIVRRGGLVAFPTETVYGLGANALDAAAVRCIFDAKGRPPQNPIIVHVTDATEAMRVVAEWPDVAQQLADTFWPGPLTLVLPKRSDVPDIVTAGLPSIAVRVPSHPVAQALLRAAALPIAAPSANRSMMVSPTLASHVTKSLGRSVDLVLDAGPTPVGIESTVIDLTAATPTILRPGTIAPAAIAAVLGTVHSLEHDSARGAARASPGLLARHYSPRARLLLVERSAAKSEQTIDALRRTNARVGALVLEPHTRDDALVVMMPGDPAAYASRLYAALHQLDEAGCDVIVVERVPSAAEWGGVSDRLRRASAEA
jgi:L-threonylcarbamoyladenylate synthase